MLSFVGKKDHLTREVRAKGRGLAPQTAYEVDMVRRDYISEIAAYMVYRRPST
jgi:hypothetical protein